MKKTSMMILCTLLGLVFQSANAAEKSAVLQWSQRVELSTTVSGIIKSVKAKVGDSVKKGQALVRMDDRGFVAHVKQAKAVVTRASETHEEAKRELERAHELFDRDAISVHDRQLVKIDYTKAFARLQEAQAQLTQAKLDLEYSVVRSPLDGIVVAANVVAGQTINNSIQANTMMVVANNHKMVATAMLTAAEIARIKKGMQFQVKVAGEIIEAYVYSLGQEAVVINNDSRYQLQVIFDNTGSLRQGETVVILLP